MPIEQYNHEYIKKINSAIRKSLASQSRVTAIRIDLRFPNLLIPHSDDTKVITRFFESLKAKIQADLTRKSKSWERRCASEIHYVWVKEVGEINNKNHYHILLMVNKDIYKGLGNFNQNDVCLGILIQQAWCSAMNIPYPENRYLVHFPENPTYWLNANSIEIENQISALNERCLYLAKHHTKHYGEGERSFGCSR
ncbi:inovirus Gp2 family protein [Morganella sp. GD04133]|uniref:inovirus Gp2 family protein n=1 Tax=Morganella sp. GD04133 TaxID=2975435 RepID=UPI002448DF9F|nr:inovirus Gp2 family protein [Morganella sp. GD04133]MDH0356653.1 inovirus Gp2 family protein [Morganella sp. GD04133]